jgi:hypothetical protein
MPVRSGAATATRLRAACLRDLLTLHKGTVKIHDLNRLRKNARFQGGYLN